MVGEDGVDSSVDVIVAVRKGDVIGLEEEGLLVVLMPEGCDRGCEFADEGCTFLRAGVHFYDTLEMFVIVTHKGIYSPKF